MHVRPEVVQKLTGDCSIGVLAATNTTYNCMYGRTMGLPQCDDIGGHCGNDVLERKWSHLSISTPRIPFSKKGKMNNLYC